ncbi:MAG: hypothetical protein UR33_C0001G0150 [Candidatus Woesebacteria bacterium GW2011_GWA2_33_20]|nr:MAG: hypothetical protein UR33_C0001G0150 [Candidatus Woesebacteria bacterium GW2011_GWA2_33_20]
MGLFKTEKEKKWAFALWIFNPVNIYATYMIGQFDIIPTFLTVLAISWAVRNKNLLPSAVLLGLGAGFKIFPLLFIIPLVLVKTDWRERFKILCTSGITYLVFSFPFILSEGFRRTAMLAGQTTKSFYAQIPISGGESIILFLAVVIFFYVLFFYKKSSIDDLWKRFFVMILIFFIFTHYHPQWFLWTMPFFTIDLIISKFKHWPLFLGVLISFVGLLFSFDPGLTIGLFAPINPLLYNLAPIWQLLGINIDLNTYRSIFQTIFVGFAVYYIYEHK